MHKVTKHLIQLLQSSGIIEDKSLASKRPLRGQLFAKEKYFHKAQEPKNIDKSVDTPETPKPFQPYDLSKSPLKPLKIRKMESNEQPLQELLMDNVEHRVMLAN